MFSFSGNSKNFIKNLTYRVVAVIVTTLLCFLCVPFDGATVEAAIAKTVVIGYYSGNTQFQNGFADDVRKSGYAYDYYQELLKYTDWKYEYVYGTPEEIQRGLNEGKIDIIAGVPKTVELQKKLYFATNPMGVEGLYIFCTPSHQERFAQASSLVGERIGFVNNGTIRRALEEYLKAQGIDLEDVHLMPFETEKDLDDAFITGQMKLIVGSDNRRPAHTKPVVKIGSVDYYFALSKNRGDLLSDLNSAQTQIIDINPSFASHLQQKYFVKTSTMSEIASEDIQYIESNNITIGAVRGMNPYSDCDSEGKPQGLIAEILQQLNEITGKEINYKFYNSYKEMYDALQNNEVSVIFPVSGDSWYAEIQGLVLSQSFANDRTAIIFKGEYNYEKDARIAIMAQSSVAEEYLRELYGEDITINVYESFPMCIKALERNQVDIIACGSNIVNRYISSNVVNNNVQVVYTNVDTDYCIGIPEGDAKLYSIFNKLYSSTKPSVFEDAVISNSYVKSEYGIRDFVSHYSSVAVVILLIVTVTIAGFAFSHNMSVKNHNKDLMMMNAQLLEKLEVIKQQKLDMRIDSLTQVNNRFRMEEYLGALLEEYNQYGRTTLYLAVMDLDKFKSINDDLGHAMGDEALIITASVLKKVCKNTSVFLARFGGDEFIMACEADSEEEFTNVLNKIQPMLDKKSEGKPYKLQVSIGVASHKFEKETLEEWFKRADAAQYEVKQEHHRLMEEA